MDEKVSGPLAKSGMFKRPSKLLARFNQSSLDDETERYPRSTGRLFYFLFHTGKSSS